MSLSSLFIAHVWKLPPRSFRARVSPVIAVPMPDGVTLATQHFAPRAKGDFPTLLMRLPYGLKSFATFATLYAERGFHVVLQACRGTFPSGGAFDPLAHERDDGLATLAWIESQPWFDGRIGLTGPSYLGYAQWAISDALPAVSALSTKVTSAEFRSVVFPSGTFHLGLWLSWLQTIEAISRSPLGFTRAAARGDIERRTAEAAMHLPLVEADIAAVGHPVPFWRHWFENAIASDSFWAPLDHRQRRTAKTPPNHFISGWYDFMIDQLLADYAALREAGQTPYLTVGPWFHTSNVMQREGLKLTLGWMRAHLLGDRSGLRPRAVRIHISGLDRWHDFDAYPPPGGATELYHLHADAALRPQLPAASPPARYRYDPTDPTPNLGGAIFAFTGPGPVDQAALEARADVLKFTSPPLTAPLTIIGNVRATLYFRASLAHADCFARLCDVDAEGISTNICDAVIRLTPENLRDADGVIRLDLSLHATAHSFAAGHRLRLQISSGAHPRYARNSGTGEPIGTGLTLIPADIEIFHDPEHPSVISLPVYEFKSPYFASTQ